MGLIEEYTKLVVGIQNKNDELSAMRPQLKMQQDALAENESQQQRLAVEQEQREQQLISEQLSFLTTSEMRRISGLQDDVARKISILENQHRSKISNIKADRYEKELFSRYALLDKLKAVLNDCKLPPGISEEFVEGITQHVSESKTRYTDQNLLQLCDDVRSSYKGLDDAMLEIKETMPEKIASFLLLRGITGSKLDNKTRIFVFLVYLCTLVLLCLFYPFVPIVLLGVSVSILYHHYEKENRILFDLLLPYSKLEDGVQFVEESIRVKIAKLRGIAMDKEDTAFSRERAPLDDEYEKLEKDKSQVESKIRNELSDDDLKDMVRKEYESQVAKLTEQNAKLNREIHKLQRFIESDEKNLPQLRERQKSMLLEIKQAYLNPTEPGTSSYLTQSFFLGIDERLGALIEFKFGGKTTLIMYKGDDCRTNKALITMMLMQLLSSMSITVLDVYLTDLKSAGMDYAPFFPASLSDKMHCCGTDSQVNEAIHNLHESMLARRREILTESPSLVEYNDTMLSRKSLPYEYIFFFLQDPTDKQMQNQELQQLLYNGPIVGIIPIVFVRHKDISHLGGKSKDETPKYVSFFQAFEGSSFIFDGVSNDLAVSTDLVTTITDMFSGERKAKRETNRRRT